MTAYNAIATTTLTHRDIDRVCNVPLEYLTPDRILGTLCARAWHHGATQIGHFTEDAGTTLVIADDGDPTPRFGTFLHIACDAPDSDTQLGICAALHLTTRVEIRALGRRVTLLREYLDSTPMSIHSAEPFSGAEVRLFGLANFGQPAKDSVWRLVLAPLLQDFHESSTTRRGSHPHPFAVELGLLW